MAETVRLHVNPGDPGVETGASRCTNAALHLLPLEKSRAESSGVSEVTVFPEYQRLSFNAGTIMFAVTVGAFT